MLKMMKNKKGSVWIWIVVILILIAMGIGAYLIFNGGPVIPSTGGETITSGSIPQPPALPS